MQLDSKDGTDTMDSTKHPDDKMRMANNKINNDNIENIKLHRVLYILIFLTYIFGIIWTCLHPVVSIITGELKCRGWFLDEHSIEIRFAEGKQPLEIPDYLHTTAKTQNISRVDPSLCSYLLENDNDHNSLRLGNMICHKHGNYFEMVKVTPISNALDASEEAIVLVFPHLFEKYHSKSLPSSDDTSTTDSSPSKLLIPLIQALKNLADPVSTPWLAKTVYVVTPTTSNDDGPQDIRLSLEQTVSSFLDAYAGDLHSLSYGKRQHQLKNMNPMNQVPPLPPNLRKAMIRNLVVINVHDTSNTIPLNRGNSNKLTGRTQLGILPQGRRGVLPNADLVFLVGKLLERASFMNSRLYTHTRSKFLTHNNTRQSIHASEAIDAVIESNFATYVREVLRLDSKMVGLVKEWANDIINMALFVETMALGPFPPHSLALERGIDSLTIQLDFDGSFRRDPSVELIEYMMEYLVRALGNLHERLHHSFTLYLLLSTPRKFVMHMEYFLPNILLLLPLAIRAFGLLLPAMTRSHRNKEKEMKVGFEFRVVVGAILATAALITTIACLPSSNDPQITLFLYIAIAFCWSYFILMKIKLQNENFNIHARTKCLQTLQFMSCVFAAYILAPIAFANTSLAYIPSLLWAPLLSFPDYGKLMSRQDKRLPFCIQTLLLTMLVIITGIPWIWVSSTSFTYTPCIKFVFIPLHFQFFLLWLTTSVL